MTHLRGVMLEELQRRNYAKTTVQYYIQANSSPRTSASARTNSRNITSARIRRTCCTSESSGRGW